MKHSIRYIIFLLACLYVTVTYAQTNLRELGIIAGHSKPSKTTEIILHTRDNYQTSTLKDDTVYSFQTKKQHGWFEPLGLLTKEQANHRGSSFMFSKKNAKGHWTKMECINAYGNHVPSGFSPYIVKLNNQKDSLINEDWAEKLKGACIFEFIPDPSGENIIQERAFDKNYNLLYAYSRIPIGSNQYIGSYKDVYGLPAEMRKEPGYKYGTLVLITEDDYGFDKCVEYIDAQRNNKPNSDGAYAEMFDYNQEGEMIRQYSVDSIGNRIIDNWGNCALIHTYYTNHLQKSSMYADEQLRPIRMPSEESGNSTGTIKSVYQYDDFFRMSQVKFMTENDEKDTNAYGCHKIVIEYDDWGNQISVIGYDSNGNLAVMDASGTAKSFSSYDKKGNCEEIQFLDKYNQPVSSDNYLCKIEYEYNDDNLLISEKRWCHALGKNKLAYQHSIKQYPKYKEEKTIWSDGASCIIRYDSKNREILTAYYNADGTPDLNYENTWSYKITEYADSAYNKSQYITSYYGIDGKLSQADNLEFNKKVAIRDLRTKQEIYKDYKNEFLVNTFSKKFANDDFILPTEQADNNVFGNVARAGGTSRVRYYNAKVKWTPFSNISYIVCEDEFGEPDYLTSNDGSTYYYKRSTSNGDVNMSAENEVLDSDDIKSIRDRLPKVMSVEIIDSIGYKKGLKDNDVILIYGDYSVDLNNNSTLSEFRKDWAISSIIEAGTDSRMVVFRIEDAKNNKYGLVEIKNLKGSPSELGFIAHIRYLTQKQKDRILSSIETNKASKHPIVVDTDFKKHKYNETGNYIVFSFPELFRADRNKPYPKQIKDPAILLGTCIRERDMYWDLRKKDDTDNFSKMLESRLDESSRYPTMLYYLTTDLNTTKTLTLKERIAGTKWYDAYVSDNDYQKLLSLNTDAVAKMDSIKSIPSAIHKNQLCSYWQVDSNDTSLTYRPEGYIHFSKNGNCDGDLICYGKIGFSEGDAIYKVDRSYNGKWQLCDSLIIIQPSSEDSYSVRGVDLLGADSELKERALAYTNTVCETHKEDILKKLTYLDINWGYDIFIHSINKDTLYIDNGNGKPIRLIKTKPKNIKSISQSKIERAVIKNEIIETDDASLLEGRWRCDIADLPGAYAIMSLSRDYHYSLNLHASAPVTLSDSITCTFVLDIELQGNWKYKDSVLSITDDPSLMKINMDCQISGISGDEANKIKEACLSEFKSGQHELAMTLLKDNQFNGDLSLTDLTNDSFMTNEIKWIKIDNIEESE